MKYSVDGTDCHCCGHGSPTVPACKFNNYHSDGTLVDSLFNHETGQTFFQAGDLDLRDTFNIESFEYGATVDAFSVSYELLESVGGAGKAGLIDLTVSSNSAGDFASGVIFWPKSYDSPVPFDPRGAVPGYQFKYLTAHGYIRNALITGQQFYETDASADAALPLPFTGIVVEFNRVQYFNVSTVAIYNRCWQGAGPNSWGGMPYENMPIAPNATTLGANGEKQQSTLSNWCLGAFGGNVIRIGFAYGLTSYDSAWTSRSLGSGTWSQSSYLSRMTGAGCYTGRCNCYAWNTTTLNLTLNAGSNPLEFQGQTATLTRTPLSGLAGGPGSTGWQFTGSLSTASSARPDIQTIAFSGPDPYVNSIRFTYGDYGEQVTDWLDMDTDAGTPTLGEIEDALNAVISEGVTLSGGPTLVEGITITSNSNAMLNCIDSDNGFFTVRRQQHGIADKTLTMDFTLTLDPATIDARTENYTPRVERSCGTLEIEYGDVCGLTMLWNQTSTSGNSNDPFLKEYVIGASSGPLCRLPCDDDPTAINTGIAAAGFAAKSYGYGSFNGPLLPSVQFVGNWGWDVTVTE